MNALLALLSIALCLVIALTARGGAAAVLFCVAVAAVVGAFLHRDKEHRTFFLRIFVGGLLLRAGLATLIYVFNLQEFFGGDALTYDSVGNSLVESWGSRYTVGGDVAARWAGVGGGWGMVYMVGIIYSVVGRNMLAVQLFNAVIGAATAPLICLCAYHIFQNRRVAYLSAFFVAFYPSLVLWSSQGLKDGPIVFLLAVAMLATLKLGERLSFKHMLALVLSLFAILSFRFYVFYMMAVAVAGSLLVGMKRFNSGNLARQLVIIVFAGLALTYLGVLRRASDQAVYFDLEKVQTSRSDLASSAKSGFGQDVDVSTTAGALSAIPLGFTYLLFAPFPWQLASLRQSITLPEMLVWWASFPLLVLGLWFTVKYRLRAALPVMIFTGMLTLAYSLFQGNVGTAYRQRAQLLVFYFIFVSVGYVLLKERREDAKRRQELSHRAVTEAAKAAQERRRAHAAARAEREREWAKVARDLSGKVESESGDPEDADAESTDSESGRSP